MQILNEKGNERAKSFKLTSEDRAQALSIIQYIQTLHKKRTEYLEDFIKAPIIKDILKGNSDVDSLIEKHLKLSSDAVLGVVILSLLERNHKDILTQIVNMSPDEQARLQDKAVSNIKAAYSSIKNDITVNGEFFRTYKLNLGDLIRTWIKDCQENPQKMRNKYGVKVKGAKDDDDDNADSDSPPDDKFYVLKQKKESCNYRFDAYDNGKGVIYVITEISDDGPIFKRIDEVPEEFKKEGREKLKKLQASRSKEEKRKAADSNFAGLPIDISEAELKNYADLLLKSLYTYYTNPAAYLDDKDTGEKFKQQLISGIMGGNYRNEKGEKIPATSSTEAFNFWYDGCWLRTSSKSNAISDRGNRYMIEAFYIVNEKNNKLGSGIDSAVEVANTALKDSKLADYNRIYSSVKISILKNYLGDIWKKASALLLKSVPRQKGDLDNAEKKMTQSSRITDINSIVVDSTICSKVKTGYDETIFNWRVLLNDKAAKVVKLELQAVFCNAYDVSKLFSKEIGKVITIDNSEILSSNFYNKKYSKGDIVEGLLTENVNIPTDIELQSFDDICEDFQETPAVVAIVNEIAHKLGYADNLDQMIIVRTSNNKYCPEYLDYSDFKQHDGFSEYEFFNEPTNIKVYFVYVNSVNYLFLKDPTTLSTYLKMI